MTSIEIISPDLVLSASLSAQPIEISDIPINGGSFPVDPPLVLGRPRVIYPHSSGPHEPVSDYGSTAILLLVGLVLLGWLSAAWSRQAKGLNRSAAGGAI